MMMNRRTKTTSKVSTERKAPRPGLRLTGNVDEEQTNRSFANLSAILDQLLEKLASLEIHDEGNKALKHNVERIVGELKDRPEVKELAANKQQEDINKDDHRLYGKIGGERTDLPPNSNGT